MTRRGNKGTVTHVHRVPMGHGTGGSGTGGFPESAKEKEVLMRKHRFLRRATGFMLARKYRYIQSMMHGSSTTSTTTTTTTISASISTTTSFTQASSSMWMNVRNTWHESEYGRDLLNARLSRSDKASNAGAASASSAASGSSDRHDASLKVSKGFTREELINFWKELSVVAKRRLLRIRREIYLTALDEFLVRQNLCCECHDNVIAEWEDHERRRSGSRSLQDVFSVFPPFLDEEEDDDDDDEEDDDEEEDDEEDEEEGELHGDEDSDDEVVLAEEELVFKYELERDELRRGVKKSMISDEYLAALEVGKRQEDELLRLIQKEERYIIIREDHTDFIMDLIRCGEQFSYVSPFQGDYDDDSDEVDDDDDDSECPGANTSHLAQEYLLEVLAIKFREQLEDAYQEALQHSLAIQAELLREEIADLQASQKPSASSKKKKNKDKKKKKKKDAAAAAKTAKAAPKAGNNPPQKASSSESKKLAVETKATAQTSGNDDDVENDDEDEDNEERSPEEDELDREVEEFRLLLEKISTESNLCNRMKLVLPPGTFVNMASMASVGRRDSTRSARQPASNNNIAAESVTSSKNRNHAKQEEEEEDSESDGSESPCCSQCAVANQRALVTCAACAAHFHLDCASPPLRRRPVLASAWRCGACSSRTEGNGESATTTRRSARNAAADDTAAAVEVVEKEAKESVAGRNKRVNAGAAGAVELDEPSSDVEPPKKSRRRASAAVPVQEAFVVVEKMVTRARRSVATTSATTRVTKSTSVKTVHRKEEDLGDESDLMPITQTLRSPPGKSTAKAPARKEKLSRAAASSSSTVKVSAKAPRIQRVRAAAPGKRQQQKAAKTAVGTDSDDDANTAGDDDNDSDFHSDDAASDDDDDDDDDASDEDASDDEFVARGKKLPKLKSPAKKSPMKRSPGPKKSPAKARARRTSAAANGDNNETAATTNGSTTNNVDSMDLASQDEEDEEEVYTGPRYFVEYAANNRAKHLECTQICISTAALTAAAATNDEPEAENVEDQKKEVIGDVNPIDGFASLSRADQAIVRAHMVKVEEQGLLDERIELSEDHYNKKARMVEKEPSPYLTVPLLPYQREALAWMTAQEKSAYRGGILADEMGMGKTIQAISVILENVRENANANASAAAGGGKKQKQKGTSGELVRGGTLVVCPLVAVMQWKTEIERFVERDHLSIYIHHGAKRTELPSKIASYDIVLTTYSIIESEIRKTLGGEKVPCKYCKKKYLPDKLVLHNKYFCGPNAKKTKLQDKQRSKKGPKRKKAAGEEDSDDEDEDDYYPKKPAPKARRGKKATTLESDGSDDDDDAVVAQPKKLKGKSPLHQVHWTRIVLDEAHYIKDRRNNTARGVFELKSEYKWCLTGTPLQNRIGELFSLIRFLQIKSYAYYHCTNCECQLLDFQYVVCHFSFFNKKIVIPIQSYGYVAEGKIAMLRLQNEVLQHILLRRTKEGRADDICLPPKLIRIRKDRLDERENDFYEAIYTQSQAQFNTYVSSGTLLNNYAHIFDLLIRLRQAVDHPYLVIFSKSNPALQLPASTSSGAIRPVVEEKPLRVASGEENDDDQQEVSCTICHEDVEDCVVAKCGHQFCRECVKEFIESLPVGAEATCPSCEQLLTVDLAPPKAPEIGDEVEESVAPHKARPRAVDLSRFHKHSILHRISDVHAFQTSTKIEALMQELALMRERDPSGKAIIFSQFVNMLDLIQHRLQLGGVRCVKLSGNMTMDIRDRTIKAFRDDPSITAFLISLKAGGVALNLTIASHIFLMDPWWNPAAESQAIDRTHRLGQFKPIQATRFIIAGTVEERILKLQEKKRLIFEGTVGASVSAVCRLTAEDLRFLFSK
ncbi:Atp-dependent helicase, partial [Globisporangium splendens]